MRWEGQRESSNIEDRRGMSPARVGSVGGLGIGGIVLVLAVSYFTGTNPLTLINMLSGVQSMTESSGPAETGPTGPPSDQLGKFASVVLADTETTWKQLLGADYKEPRLVLFSGSVRSACGTTSSAVGPFYCPGDHKVYLDLTFFNEMAQRLGAPGDFAQAYVIAHEVGHHVQNLTGVTEKITRLQRQASEKDANALSVRMELQADCFAGVWGHHANRKRNLIEPGDFEEGLKAAAAIGDDRLQKMGQGYVQPESWTHGSSDQRMTWLRRGLESGDPNVCNTFEGPRS
ncbi:MAG: neutral zinc metallopeptidase [Nitrospira sp.]|nr:neutral zinc metallopeptidase [Nitrospira sp.]